MVIFMDGKSMGVAPYRKHILSDSFLRS
jgi:hypothetical protein